MVHVQPALPIRANVEDTIVAWVQGLRGRVDRSELADLSPVNIGHGNEGVPVEWLVRVMLADLESCVDLPPKDYMRADHIQHREALINEFMRLRDLIG